MPLFEDNEEQRLFRQEFRKFCAREITPNVEAWEQERAVPRDALEKNGRSRVFSAPGCRRSTAASTWISVSRSSSAKN